jgi:protein required for attachment to host cells
MQKTCIAVVDASRARLFTYERSMERDSISERMTEQRDLINPSRRLVGVEQFEGHRDAQIEELDHEFARTVVSELVHLLRSAAAKRVILCASSEMLTDLREAGHELSRDLPIDEVPRDLVELTTNELRDELTDYGVLPAPPARA